MRRLLPVLCLAVLAAGCSGLGVRNQDAATVNGVGIPTDRLSEMTKAQLGQQQQAEQQGQQQPQDIEGATRQALEGLIQFQLVLDGAKKEGLTIQESDVDARMEQLKQQVAAQGQNFEELLTTDIYGTVALRTIGIAALVTVTDVILAFPIAYFMARVA